VYSTVKHAVQPNIPSNLVSSVWRARGLAVELTFSEMLDSVRSGVVGRGHSVMHGRSHQS
jgi:hypothetical protein